jgi:hypothetical protein
MIHDPACHELTTRRNEPKTPFDCFQCHCPGGTSLCALRSLNLAAGKLTSKPKRWSHQCLAAVIAPLRTRSFTMKRHQQKAELERGTNKLIAGGGAVKRIN